jgi:hypothetical protein
VQKPKKGHHVFNNHAENLKNYMKKKNTAGSIYNCTAKDVRCDNVVTANIYSCKWYGTHVAVTSLFPAKQPYLPNYKTLSRQNVLLEWLVDIRQIHIISE